MPKSMNGGGFFFGFFWEFGRSGRRGGGGDYFDGDFWRKQYFQAALEGTFDEIVDDAAAAGADQHALCAADGGGFGDHLGGIVAGVVHGNDGDAVFVAVLEPFGEEGLGGGITF